jgi:hypothetical protein
MRACSFYTLTCFTPACSLCTHYFTYACSLCTLNVFYTHACSLPTELVVTCPVVFCPHYCTSCIHVCLPQVATCYHKRTYSFQTYFLHTCSLRFSAVLFLFVSMFLEYLSLTTCMYFPLNFCAVDLVQRKFLNKILEAEVCSLYDLITFLWLCKRNSW